MKKVKNILFVSRDPGGTNPLVALHDIFSGNKNLEIFRKFKSLERDLNLSILAKDYAVAVWESFGITPEKWQDKIVDNNIISYLSSLKPDWIITSTSHVDDRTEQNIWQTAKALGIATTAVLDSGHNVALRFQDDAGNLVAPSELFVPNEAAKNDLLSIGIEENNILITGDLFGDFIKDIKPGEIVQALRNEWRGEGQETLILFASDYISEAIEAGYSYGVTEFQYLDCLIEMLENGAIGHFQTDLEPPYRIIIRPHPKDTPGKYDPYEKYKSEKIIIKQSDRGNSLEAVQAVDIVAGMSSSLLHEAEVLGRDTLRLMTIYPDYRDLQKKL